MLIIVLLLVLILFSTISIKEPMWWGPAYFRPPRGPRTYIPPL